MNVLLVWEENPESVKFFLIKDPTEFQLKMLNEANNRLVNGEEMNDGMEYLMNALAKEEYKDDSFKDTDWHLCEVKTPISSKINKVFYSGFVL